MLIKGLAGVFIFVNFLKYSCLCFYESVLIVAFVSSLGHLVSTFSVVFSSGRS